MNIEKFLSLVNILLNDKTLKYANKNIINYIL